MERYSGFLKILIQCPSWFYFFIKLRVFFRRNFRKNTGLKSKPGVKDQEKVVSTQVWTKHFTCISNSLLSKFYFLVFWPPLSCWQFPSILFLSLSLFKKFFNSLPWVSSFLCSWSEYLSLHCDFISIPLSVAYICLNSEWHLHGKAGINPTYFCLILKLIFQIFEMIFL